MKNYDTRRSDDVDINLWGVRVSGPVKALIALFSGTASILALIGVVLWHTVDSIKSNTNLLAAVLRIEKLMDLQNAILIIPQSERGALAHKLPPDVQKSLGMVEGR